MCNFCTTYETKLKRLKDNDRIKTKTITVISVLSTKYFLHADGRKEHLSKGFRTEYNLIKVSGNNTYKNILL